MCALARAHPVSWDQPELRPVLEEDVARALLGVDANAIVGDDGARLGRDLELRGDRRGTRTKRESRGWGKRQHSSLFDRWPRHVALAARETLTSSAAYLSTAVKGASSGTLRTLYGSLGSEVSVILNVTFDLKGWESDRARERGAEGRSQSFASFPARAFAAPYSHRSLSLSLSRQPGASLPPRMQSTPPHAANRTFYTPSTRE